MANNSNTEKKFILETVNHVQKLKEKINELNCDTDSEERTLSLIMEENSGKLDHQVEKDLLAIDNLLENVANKLRLKD